MSNSPLVTYTKISPNKSSPRNHKIDTITIHCVVGQLTAKQIVNLTKFQNSSGNSSCNYAVGTDGSIGLCVEEKDRAWTSSSRSNDHRAITIEVASDTKPPYAVNDKAMAALIELVADICKRNGIKELKWKGDKSLVGQVDKQNMTAHRWFAATACPGDYLYGKFDDIAAAVNKKLNPVVTKPSSSSSSTNASLFKNGDAVKLKTDAKYTSGKSIPSWVFNSKLYVRCVNGNKITISTQSTGDITGVVYAKDLIPCGTTAKPATTNTFKSYVVEITANALNVRAGAGSTYKINTVVKKGQRYTIVEEKNGWGKLKSGAGWISLKYTKKV